MNAQPLRWWPLHLGLSSLVFCLTGCAGQTTMTRHFAYPTEGDFQNGKYILVASATSEKGMSFAAASRKDITIYVFQGNYAKRIMERNYSCFAASVNWNVTWLGDGRASVEVMEAGYSERSGRKLMSLSYSLDPMSGVFTEDVIPMQAVGVVLKPTDASPGKVPKP